MRKTIKNWLLLIGASLIAMVLFVIHWQIHDSKIANLEAINVGMTSDEVIRIMGTPESKQACNWEFVNNDDPSCGQSYVYASTLAPLIPYYPVVWMSKDGRVIRVYAYSSP